AQAQASILSTGPEIWGLDIDGRAIEQARQNAKIAQSLARFQKRSVDELELPQNARGWIVSNVPYGHRLKGSSEWLKGLERLLEKAPAWEWSIFAMEKSLKGRSPILEKAKAKHFIRNGRLDCALISSHQLDSFS
ncbi:MAG: hypothetical protein N2515_00450, partial [Deltaproteobacteria bacterium]|nr:hypothetical protein [Deltaproteobacteria bacterium]